MTFEMLFMNSSSRQMIGICFVYVVSSFETLGWFCDWRFQYCHNLINLSRDSGLFNLYETMTFEMLFVDPSSQQMIDIFVFCLYGQFMVTDCPRAAFWLGAWLEFLI